METQPSELTLPEPKLKSNLLLLLGSVTIALLFGALLGYFSYPMVNKQVVKTGDNIESQLDPNAVINHVQPTSSLTENNQISDSRAEPAFCKEYGTREIPKRELLEKYTTGPGDTLRAIAKNQLGDETKAMNLVDDNPQLQLYEIDDELQMNLTLYIPNDTYNKPGITSYMRANGNITYNDEKPMFGVNAPNSGTGPFLINDEIADELSTLEEGECVEVIYGSRQLDAQKVVFAVSSQN